MTLAKKKKNSEKKASALNRIDSCRGASGQWRLKPWQRSPGGRTQENVRKEQFVI